VGPDRSLRVPENPATAWPFHVLRPGLSAQIRLEIVASVRRLLDETVKRGGSPNRACLGKRGNAQVGKGPPANPIWERYLAEAVSRGETDAINDAIQI
jgi:hypothetical protein